MEKIFSSFNSQTDYTCFADIKANNFSKLQYLIINYNKYIDNYLDLIQEDINYNKKINPDYINHKNSLGYTALMLSCTRNIFKQSKGKILLLLLKNGANINSKNNNRLTALMLSCRYSHTYFSLDSVKSLLENGADINITDNYGWTALMLSSRYSATIVPYGVVYTGGSTVDTVRLLIDYKANVDITDKQGDSALSIASMFSKTDSTLETVSLLLNKSNMENRNKSIISAIKGRKIRSSDMITIKMLFYEGAVIDYGEIDYILCYDDKIFEICLENLNFRNIEKVKQFYSMIKDTKIFKNKFNSLIYDYNYSKKELSYILE